MNKLENISRRLTRENIDYEIEEYLTLLDDFPISLKEENTLDFLYRIKRGKTLTGPYPDVSIFEAANRIMTDLVILFGAKKILSGCIPEIEVQELIVELGNEDQRSFDITGKDLRGEAFNVAPSFFQNKKSSALKKLRNNSGNEVILLMYNEDAVTKTYIPQTLRREFHLRVKLKNEGGRIISI